MSVVKVSGNASGTGIFTVAAPATNTDRTLTLPNSSGTVATAESTLLQFNVSGSAPVYACRAWVNFNGTGTIAIRSSGNVTSIGDLGVGSYRVNFTTAMPDANYCANVTTSLDGVIGTSGTTRTAQTQAAGTMTTTACDVGSQTTNTTAPSDCAVMSVAIFR